MTSEEKLVDDHVVDCAVMFAHLGYHLTTLDSLRDEHKHAALERFGLVADPTIYEGDTQRLVQSHVDQYDNQMGAYLRYAHIVLTYLVFEDRLYAFSRLLSVVRRRDQFVSMQGKGSLLKQFERYLNEHSIKPPPSDGVEALRLIRNCVVHCRGSVSDFGERDKLRACLPDIVGVLADSRDRLVLTTEGCLLLQEEAVQYIHAINSAAGFRIWIPPQMRKHFDSGE